MDKAYEDWLKDMDRRIEGLTQSSELLHQLTLAMGEKSAEAAARHDREMAEIRLSQAKLEANHAKLEASQAKTEAALRRAIRLSVLDARRQRTRNQEFQREMEERDLRVRREMDEIRASMKAYFDSLRGGNGQH